MTDNDTKDDDTPPPSSEQESSQSRNTTVDTVMQDIDESGDPDKSDRIKPDEDIETWMGQQSDTGGEDTETGDTGDSNTTETDIIDSLETAKTDVIDTSETDVIDTSETGVNNSPKTDTSRSRDRSSTRFDFNKMLETDEESENKGLFDDLLAGEPIFENKEVLRPSYTPHELPHRNDQINQMATILVSALRGETPSNILIYGKTGTGKTASAKFVSQELESTSQKYDVPCEVQYINCEVTDTQYRVLAQLANKIIEQNRAAIESRLEYLTDRLAATTEGTDFDTVEFDRIDRSFDSRQALEERIDELESDRADMEPVPMTGWPTDRVYSTFFDAVDYRERVVVIMLDEIDKLVEKSGDDTLYNLSRMNSELINSRISIMGISNDLKFTDFLDPRVKSSLGEEEIVFPPYDATQLRDILQHRADIAFKPNALSDDVIPLCAAFAAQEHGDARRALDLLRTAGELAERDQQDTIVESHVRQAQDKIELDRVVEVVRTLPTQSKIVLFSIILLEKNGVHNINTGEVFNIYKRICQELDADVLTQRRVTDLISELDMLGIVNAVVVSKGRYGRTKEISLSVPIDETEAVLLSDSRLGDLDNVQPFVQARFDN